MADDMDRRVEKLSPLKRQILQKLLEQKSGAGAWLNSRVRTLGMMSVAELQKEAILSPDIDPDAAAAWKPGTARAVLLTGATGYLGIFLLEELLKRTSATIYCLVRAHSAEEAKRRIDQTSLTHMVDLSRWNSRIVPVVGDLALPQLGVSPKTFDALAEQIDVIYHCGALVKWTMSYPSLRKANVEGTEEILRLATRFRVKPVHYMSTVGVFSSPEYPSEVVLETEALENSGALAIGYAQSKWVGEKLVRIAASRGLPVSIYRPNSGGHSETGVCNANDYLTLLIKGCIQLGSTPEQQIRISGAPVDFISQALVYLSQQEASLGKTFHLVNPDDMGWNELCAWMRSYGYHLRHLPYPEWREELQSAVKQSSENALYSFSPFFSPTGLDLVSLPRFDCRGTLDALQETSITCLPLGPELLATYFSYLIRTDKIAAPG